MVRFEFTHVHIDGQRPQTLDELLLRIVGDFAIVLDHRTLYQESEFCGVEFGRELARWLAPSRGGPPEFVYHSMEAKEPLIWFRKTSNDRWTVEAAHQEFDGVPTLSRGELQRAARAYIRSLSGAVRDATGISIGDAVRPFIE